MSIEYAGLAVYHATITIMEDGDGTDAASYAVGLEQLADRITHVYALVGGGVDPEFTDATFHGTTTFADGDIVGTLDTITLAATTGEFFIGGNSVAIGSTTTLTVNTTQGMAFQAGDDITIDVAAAKAVIVTGGAGSAVDIFGGRLLIPASGAIELAAAVKLGGGTGDNVTVQGTLLANHNSTFAAGKVVDLDGSTRADELRATVSNIAGITYTSVGRAHYRRRLLVNADSGGGPFQISPDIADVFYVNALSADMYVKIDNGGTSVDGDIIEVSTYGMTGGFNFVIYAADETTVLLTMTATGNSWSRWLVGASSSYRLLAVSDG